MSFWDKGLAQLAAYRAVCEDLAARRTPIQLVGLAHIHKVLFAASLVTSLKKRAVLLAGDEAEANRLTEDLKALGLRVLYLPARELSLRQIEARQQSPDHPILWNVPETDYLKFYIFQIV